MNHKDKKIDETSFDRSRMSFGDHLEELRKRLVLAIVVPLPLSVVLFFFAASIRSVLVLPALAAMEANGLPARLQALGPAEVLTTDLKLSFIGAAVIGQVRYFNRHEIGRQLKGERLDIMAGPGGIADCGNAQNCVKVCPKDIPLTEAIADIGRQSTLHAIKKFFTGK